MVTSSRAISVASAHKRLAAANRALAIARGRAAAGDPDDRQQEREAIAQAKAARAELTGLEADGGETLRQTRGPTS